MDAKTKSAGKSEVKEAPKEKMLKKIRQFFRDDGKSVKTGKYKDYLLTRFKNPIRVSDFVPEYPHPIRNVFDFLEMHYLDGHCGDCDAEFTTVIISELEKRQFEPDGIFICYCDDHVPIKYTDSEVYNHNGRKYILEKTEYFIFGTMMDGCGTTYLLVIDLQGHINVFDNDIDEELSGVLWKYTDVGFEADTSTIKGVHKAIEENL